MEGGWVETGRWRLLEVRLLLILLLPLQPSPWELRLLLSPHWLLCLLLILLLPHWTSRPWMLLLLYRTPTLKKDLRLLLSPYWLLWLLLDTPCILHALPLLLPLLHALWIVTARTQLEGWPLWLVPSWVLTALLEGWPLLLPLLAPFLVRLSLLAPSSVLLLLAVVLQEGQPLGRPTSGPNRYEILPRAPLLQQPPLQCIKRHRGYGK